jgi:uncharacterized protein
MTTELIILCCAAFAAGFIDSIVGGGGLVQTPVALVVLPQYSVATVLGSIKIPSFGGTFIAFSQYTRRVTMEWRLLLPAAAVAGIMAFTGSWVLTRVNSAFMKPAILLILIATAIYSFSKKDLGSNAGADAPHTPLYKWLLVAAIIGFYDGFIGPGAGSFLVLAFVGVMKFPFLKAGGHAKLVNLATNLGSIMFFVLSGHILYQYALPMMVLNAAGAFFGSRLAIFKGNRFIRVFFLCVIAATIARLGYDVVKQWWMNR